jgi:hypothetical protein
MISTQGPKKHLLVNPARKNKKEMNFLPIPDKKQFGRNP